MNDYIKYFRIKGRINRAEFLFITILFIVLAFIAFLIFGQGNANLGRTILILFIFYLLQCAKRYHDMNKNAINGFVWWIVPIANIYFFIQLLLNRGTLGVNKYGNPSTFSWSIIFKPKENAKEYGNFNSKENILKEKEYEIGEFNSLELGEVVSDKEFYLIEYAKHDGEFIEKDEIICTVKIKNIDDYRASFANIKAQHSGVLECVMKEGEKLSDGMRIFDLHERGKYKNENSIENSVYNHYFYKGENNYSFKKWLVSDGDYLKKGDKVYLFGDSKNDFEYKAEKDGFIEILVESYLFLKSKELIYRINDSDSERVKRKYFNEPLITIDEFTNDKNLTWKSVNSGNGTYIVTKSDDKLVDLRFTFNYVQKEDKIIFYFSPNQIKLKQNDKIIFLFENEETIEYNLESNPIIMTSRKNVKFLEYRTSILESELELFCNHNLKRWKIILTNEGREILGGKIGDINYSSENNLKIVIKKLALDYKALVNRNIENYKPLIFRNQSVDPLKKEESCYVYLMKDFANGYHKIGISNKPYYREKTLQSEKPTIELVSSKQFPLRKIAESFEKALHETYKEKRIRGEWFNLDDVDVEMIIQSLK